MRAVLSFLALAALLPAPCLADEDADLARSLRPEGRRLLQRQLDRAARGAMPRYRIALDLDLDLAAFHGTLELRVVNDEAEPWPSVVLRLFPNSEFLAGAGSRLLHVDRVRVAGQAARVEEGATWLRVRLAAPLAPGRATTIALHFRGTLPRRAPGSTGMGQQAMEQLLQILGLPGAGASGDYGLYSQADGISALGFFHPVLAERCDGAWVAEAPAGIGDIGGGRLSHFVVEVTTSRGATVVAGGVPLGPPRVQGRRQVQRFAASAVRDFALAASHDFTVAHRKAGPVEVYSYALTRHADKGRRVLDLGVEALQTYEPLFGAYPYSRLSLVELPLVGGAGGIEYPTMLGFASMLYGSDDEAGILGLQMQQSPMLDEMLEFVVAHEVAHQWWNALVGSDSARHPVIDEALAQYSSVLFVEQRRGQEAAEHAIATQVAGNYHLLRLLGGKDAAADRPAAEFDDMLAYAGLVYGKAPLFYRAVREVLGDKLFFAVLKRYAQVYAFREADGDGFINRVRRLAPGKAAEVARLKQRWWEQAHGDRDLGKLSWSELLMLYSPEDTEEGQQMRQMIELLKPLLDLFGG